jgi:hypothetical protein
MPEYTVSFAVPVFISVDLVADDEEEAKEEALTIGQLQHFVGNGGLGDKLIGTSDPDVRIENAGEVLEKGSFEIEVRPKGE